MKNIWIKTLLIIAIISPTSIFLHELGHWIVYEINGIDSWISLQRVNLIDPGQVTESIFFVSLFGGPIVTIFLAVASLLLLIQFRNSIWILVLGLVNVSLRILPTFIGAIKSVNTENLNGFSDEGNIVLRITDNIFLREIVIIILFCLFIFLIVKFFKTFQFPEEIMRKKTYFAMIIILPFFISMILPKLDFIIFGI